MMRKYYILPIPKEYLINLENSMDLRHQADYGLDYSSEDAATMIENASDFFLEAKKLLKK